MKKITKYFTHDYENDTTIEYVNTGFYCALTCSFTSEDIDMGTETIHFNTESAECFEEISYELLREIKQFLDCRKGVPGARMPEHENYFCKFCNTTLYAIENALFTITKNFSVNKRYMTIWDASEWVAKEFIKNRRTHFAFVESNEEEAQEDPNKHVNNGGWHGIKRIDGFFDNEEEEFIIAVGHYGGGHVAFGYSDFRLENDLNEYARVIRGAICQSLDCGSSDIIYIEKEEN